jgi:hypothetical protein
MLLGKTGVASLVPELLVSKLDGMAWLEAVVVANWLLGPMHLPLLCEQSFLRRYLKDGMTDSCPYNLRLTDANCSLSKSGSRSRTFIFRLPSDLISVSSVPHKNKTGWPADPAIP